MSLNNAYVRPFQPVDLLDGGTAAARWDQVDLMARNRHARKGEASWTLPVRTSVHGLAVWWAADLGGGVSLSTSPLAAPTHWEQLFLPAIEPVDVEKGETLRMEIGSRSTEEGGTDLAWSLAVDDARGRQRLRHAMSLAKGFLP